MALLATAMPAAAVEPSDGQAPATVDAWGPGEEFEQPPTGEPCGGPLQPPCPATETAAGGAGGYIPVPAERVLDTRTDPAGPIGQGKTRVVPLGGIGSVPLTGVEAVALSLEVFDSTGWSSVTVWPTGSPRPAAANLFTQPGRPQRVLAIVPLGSDGSISVFNERGTVGAAIEVLGWFSGVAEITSVPPARLLDTNPGGRVKPAPLGPEATTKVIVLGRGGVPTTDVAAVVLAVSSRTSTLTSGVTIWPQDADRPATPSLVVQPADRRDNLVLVAPGTDGAVAVRNEAGWTHLTVDVVGWVPAGSSYRAVAAAEIWATEPGGLVADGETVEIQVAGNGGVPALDGNAMTEDPHAVVVNITATPMTAAATAITAWRSGDELPATTSVATSATTQPTTSLTVVPISPDGTISLHNEGAAARVAVAVVGWFAVPMVAAQVEVPETTKAPAPEEIEQVDVTTDETGAVTGATVVLEAAAPDVAEGEHLVLGITETTPEGLLGTVTDVTTQADGSQVVTTAPATLDEVFPEGDIVASLAGVSQAEAAAHGVVVTAAVMEEPPPGAGVRPVEDPYKEATKGKDPTSGVDCSLEGVIVDFGPYVDMEFRVRWRAFDAPVVTALATLGAQAKLALEDVAVRCGWDKVLWRGSVTFVAAVVPVVVTFQLGAAIDVEAGLAGLNIGAGAKAWVTVGVKDNTGYVDAGWDAKYTSLDQIVPEARNLRLYAMVDAWLTFDVRLYGMIGPRIAVGPFVETSFSTVVANPIVPWWTLELGLAGRVDLKLSLWFKTWSWKLWEGEIPLADYLGDAGLLKDCSGDSRAFVRTDPWTPCRGPKPTVRANGQPRDNMRPRIRLASSSGGFAPLRIDGPSNLTLTTGSAVDVDFDVSGDFSSGALMRVAEGSVPGLALTDLESGWSTTGRLVGTAPAPGTYTLELEARYAVEEDPPVLALRAHKTFIVTVQPPEVFGVSTAVAAGYRHTCSLLANGSVVCWGQNEAGQLGDGTTENRLTPVRVTGSITGAVAVTAGWSHTCLLRGGKVSCWGSNYSGQLGDGSTTNRRSPSPVAGISTAAAIAAGERHTCAVLEGGTVMCWGSNANGQLGDGTVTNSSVPVAVAGITNATAIAAGDQHTCVLLSSGGVQCWGDNQYGQLGDQSTTDRLVPVAVWDVSSVAAISAGSAFTCALLTPSGVRCWGSNGSGQLGNGSVGDSSSRVTVSGITKAAAIGTGNYHACAVLDSGEIRCWGRNGDGQVGDNSVTNRRTPVSVLNITTGTVVTGGTYHTCALQASGSIACWGDNSGGQVGDATTTDRLWPVPVIGFATVPGPPTGVTATGGNSSAIVSWTAPFDNGGGTITAYTATATPGGATCTWTDGPLTCTVTDLQNGTPYTFKVTATNAMGTGAASMASPSVTPAATAPGRPTDVMATPGNAQATVSWVAPASDGGSPITKYTATAVPGGRTCTWATGPLSCTVTGLTNGTAYMFTVTATNAKGTSAASDSSASVTPATIPGVPAGVAASAFDHAALVYWNAPATDGGSPITGYTVTAAPGGQTCTTTDALSCVVDDLDNGTSYAFSVTATNAVGIGGASVPSNAVRPGPLVATDVAGAGLWYGSYSCAVLSTGSVICWGDNTFGQLGNGTKEAAAVPVVVRGISTATKIATGDTHACALVGSGSVVCWGENGFGQLGNGSTTDSLVPVAVPGIANATAIAAGNGVSCALLATGAVRCWGTNRFGELGNGTTVDSSGSPVAVSTITSGVTAIAVGAGHACAVRAGSVFCWGDGDGGALGDPTGADHRTPVQVGGIATASGVAVGFDYSCAVLSSGSVTCWGRNEYGELGNGTTVSSPTPVMVSGVSDATAIVAGGEHTCARLSSGSVLCWGDNGEGALGDATTALQSSVPVPVPGIASATGIAAGGHHTCALRGPGWVACWGDNTDGALGDGTLTSSSALVIVLGFPTLPGAPTGVTATPGNGRATVSWSAPDADGGSPITRYTVTASPAGLGCATSGTSCVVGGLANGVEHTFTVWAINGVGVGPASGPSDPVTPTAGATADTRLVAWGDSSAGKTVVPDVADVVAVSAGAEHTLALRYDGTVLAWGDDTYGQATVPADLAGVVAIAAGGHHSLALRGDGTAEAWGANDAGQATVPSGLANVVAIAAGARHSLALLGDGTVVGWGDDTNGAATPPVGLGPVTAIAAGAGFSLALLGDGTVVAWGDDTNGGATVPEDLANVVAISAGSSFAVALTADNQVVAWGNNEFGQTDVSGEASSVSAIAAGANHVLALTTDGMVVAWGDNAAEQAAVPAGLGGVLAITAGGSHSVALVTREQAISFDPACPALVGQPSAVIATASSGLPVTFTATPAEVCTVDATMGDLTLLAAGTCSVTATQPGNQSWDPAPPVTRHVTVRVPDSPIVSWGDVSSCQGSVPAGITNPVAVAAGDVHNLALTADGHVVGWGDDQVGQATPPAGLDGVIDIDAGYLHSLALRSDHTVVAWGLDDAGQGSIPDALAGELVGITAISAGGSHNLALRSDGTVVAWGSNGFGESTVPAGLGVVTAIAAGGNHSLALRSDGTVVAWGDNSFGQLSVPAGLGDVTAIAAGGNHSLALRSDGTVVAWGDNGFQQASVPAGLTGVLAIAAGGNHSLGLRSDGTVVAWGGITPRMVAIPAGLDHVIAIDAGAYHSVALSSQ